MFIKKIKFIQEISLWKKNEHLSYNAIYLFSLLFFDFFSSYFFRFHFSFHLLGSNSVCFNTTAFHEGKSISLESNSYFLFFSSFSLKFYEKCNCSMLQIEHYFNIDSMLFQKTLGNIMRKLLEERLQRALKNLKTILYNLQSDGFLLLYWILNLTQIKNI